MKTYTAVLDTGFSGARHEWEIEAESLEQAEEFLRMDVEDGVIWNYIDCSIRDTDDE